jgi:exodeoxyribonuclease V alpha subunit
MQSYKGYIDNITYHNHENGFTIARLVADGEQKKITVVGAIAALEEGEHIEVDGTWNEHPKYGRQFKIEEYRIIYPTTAKGIEKYLGSGLIRGIGPVSAKRIVDHFGKAALDVIDENPMRLTEVPKLGRKRINLIAESWGEQRQIKDVMVFLQSHGITTGWAVKIYKEYGHRAIETVKSNPYRLEQDIRGIGFIIADQIALNLGIAADAPERVEALIRYRLNKAAEDGHVYLPAEHLRKQISIKKERTEKTVDISPDLILSALESLRVDEAICMEESRCYLPLFFHAEVGIASSLRRLIQKEARKTLDFHKIDEDLELAAEQQLAVELSVNNKVLLLTGGPGTGKTTVTKRILQQFEANGLNVALCSPTGRAAKRLAEATGRRASTIHRLLEFKPDEQGFNKNFEKKLDIDALIVDESSMIDVVLMNALLRSLQDYTRLIMVGDVDQLPSVGPGNVLRDIIDSKAVPVVSLRTIFRQAEDSYIITNAHRINCGELPHIDNRTTRDFFFVEESEPSRVADHIEDLCTRRLPAHGGYNPKLDIQVLSPMYRGETGATNLNKRLQERLDVKGHRLSYGDGELRLGDKVMQTKNNYDKGVFNGDMGIVEEIKTESQEVKVKFENIVNYDSTDLGELTLAYAISTHRAQGSEFPVVILPLTTQHYIMLQRNLLYTAVTRAKELIVIVGARNALSMAVKNNKVKERLTTLNERLRL